MTPTNDERKRMAMEINGKEYPLWSQFVEKQKNWIGGELQDLAMGLMNSTKITGIELRPNGDDSAFFSIKGDKFDCGFDVQYGGITSGEEGFVTFSGYGGHTFRIRENPKPVGDFMEMQDGSVMQKLTVVFNYYQTPERRKFLDIATQATLPSAVITDFTTAEVTRIKVVEALERVAAETEARVRAETIEECAKVCDNEEKEYKKSMEEFDRLGDTRTGTNEARCAVTAKYCAELIRALASNRSREGEK